MRERVRVHVKYRRGEQGHYAPMPPGVLSTVLQQRVTRRDVLGPVINSLLACQGGTFWASEADLTPAVKGEG